MEGANNGFVPVSYITAYQLKIKNRGYSLRDAFVSCFGLSAMLVGLFPFLTRGKLGLRNLALVGAPNLA